DQPRQINPLAPDGVLAKDSPRPESFSDLVTPRRLGHGRGTPTIRAGGGLSPTRVTAPFHGTREKCGYEARCAVTARDLPYSSVGTAKEKTEEQRRRRREDENLAQAGEPDQSGAEGSALQHPRRPNPQAAARAMPARKPTA